MHLTRVVILGLTVAAFASFAQTNNEEIEASLDKTEAQSRTQLIQSARTEKEATLTPWVKPKAQRRIEEAQESLAYRLLTGDARGWTVSFGNNMPGSGFAIGPAYTKPLLEDKLIVHAEARASINHSYGGRIELSVPHLISDKAFVSFSAQHRNMSQMPYYGPGPDSRKTGRSDYRLEDTSVELRPGVHVLRGLRAELIGSYLAVNTGPGQASQFISSEQQFGPDAAPGIDRQTSFWRGGGLLEYDWRDQSVYPTRGGKYSAQYVRSLDRESGAYSFLRLDLDATQYFPLFNGTRVFTVHGSTSLTTTGTGQAVPFYLQPTLGGSNTLRGYRINRFAGDNSVMVNGEYRWSCSAILDMAVFADAGKVFQRWEQWNVHDLESDVGFSMRFKGRAGAPAMSIDTGFSHEGFQIWFRINNFN